MMRIPITIAALALASMAFSAPAPAAPPKPLPNPDLPAVTKPVEAGSAAASSRQAKICPAMRRWARYGNSRPALRVRSLDSGKTICGLNSGTSRSLASNNKLFTTSAALARLGAGHRFKTRLFANGKLNKHGLLKGNLFLKGGGDPALGTKGFLGVYLDGNGTRIERLATLARRAGIRKVSGRLIADDTIFDSRRGVPDSGYATSPYIGPLSGLDINAGYTSAGLASYSSNPARTAARKLVNTLRHKGIRIRSATALRRTPKRAKRNLIGVVRSPNLAWNVRTTLLYSNNFFAEMLEKNLGARFRGLGTTRRGAAVVENYARSIGVDVDQKDGSGLTYGNTSTTGDVVKLLSRVRHTNYAKPFLRGLPTAGVDGTLAYRMRGTAARGRCHAKTGTLTGVSSLSGYCFNKSGRKFAFSILMNGVSNLYSAHAGQDRIAAAIAAR